MRMHRVLALTVVLLADAGATQGAGKEDLQKLQGTWAVLSLEDDGKALPEGAVKGSTFVMKGDRYTLKGGEDSFRGALKLDPSQKPKALDATFVDAEGKDTGKAHGIYELDGDRLKISWREQGDRRPTDFTSKPGSGARLIVLKRAK